MAITKYEPFRELLRMQDQMQRLFDERFWGGRGFYEEELAAGTYPRVDVYDDVEGVTVTADLPGMDPKSVDVSIEGATLCLSGTRRLEREEKKDKYLRVERAYGDFCRTFTLPSTVDAEKARAELKYGLLKVFLPKTEEAKPRSIKVKID